MDFLKLYNQAKEQQFLAEATLSSVTAHCKKLLAMAVKRNINRLTFKNGEAFELVNFSIRNYFDGELQVSALYVISDIKGIPKRKREKIEELKSSLDNIHTIKRCRYQRKLWYTASSVVKVEDVLKNKIYLNLDI